MKIYDVVIYLQFARDGEDFQMMKKLTVNVLFFFSRENQFVIVVSERFER